MIRGFCRFVVFEVRCFWSFVLGVLGLGFEVFEVRGFEVPGFRFGVSRFGVSGLVFPGSLFGVLG